MASVTCDRCGTVNLPNATYCASCGRALQVVNIGVGANEGANEGVNVDMHMGAGLVASTATGRLQPDSLLKQRYRILNTTGKGGMGAVYVAEDTRLGNRVVAIKEMSQSGLSPQKIVEATENFKKEAHILAGLQHSQLPGIYDYFTDSGRWYLVMSFIQGESLENYLAKVPGRKLPVQQVLEIGIQLCIVLDYLHKQSPPIIFRDLKPANIMLTPDGRLYLIDFGIARLFKPGQALDTAAYGSVGYSAPEQYGQAQTTPRSDIYSLGAVLHQLLTGRHPSLTPFDFPSLHASGQPVPPALETLIQHMLDMKESKRPPDMASVQHALQQIASDLAAGSPIPLVPPAPYAPTVLVRRPAPGAAPPQQLQQPQQPQQRPALAPTVPFQQAQPVKPSSWRLGRPQLISILIGTLICALLQYFSYQLSFVPWFQFAINGTSIFVDDRLILTSAVLVITFFLGALHGPWAGLVVGGVGSIAADVLSSAHLGLWYLDIGLAVAGFVVGLICLRASSRQNLTHNIGFVDAVAVLGILIYAVFSALGLLLVDQMAAGDTLTLTLAYNAMYLVLTLLALTILLSIYNATARRRAIA